MLVGCNGYRPLALTEQTAVIEQKQIAEIDTIELLTNGVIDEKSAVDLALRFNPDIRIPIIRNRGWGDNEVQFRGVARPELSVSKEDATMALNIDVLSLYNLLNSDERHVWREMRRAERTQAFAEQTGGVIRLTRDVHLAFLELARFTKQREILEHQLSTLHDYHKRFAATFDIGSGILYDLSESELKTKIANIILSIDNANLLIKRLIGIEPEHVVRFNTESCLNVTVMPEMKTVHAMSELASNNNWLLISLSSQYIRKEYELRQSYLRRWGNLSVGPSMTFTRDGNSAADVSAGVSVRLRIPWPSHSDDQIHDVSDERLLAAARYTEALHNLQSDIIRQYTEMLEKWKRIKNPTVSTEWLSLLLAGEAKSMTVHAYLDALGRIGVHEIQQVDDIARYKLANIILDSLLASSASK